MWLLSLSYNHLALISVVTGSNIHALSQHDPSLSDLKTILWTCSSIIVLFAESSLTSSSPLNPGVGYDAECTSEAMLAECYLA